MESKITIRPEGLADRILTADVVQRAYAHVAYSDHREHLMVERLRATAAYIPTLSLLAEIEGEAVGHVLLTRAFIQSQGVSVATLALAPLSVVPEFQGRGVGKALVTTAHQQAAALGFGSIVLVGIPGYYPAFGYEPLRHYPITLPFDAPAENCLILSLFPGALEGVAGQVEYAKEWLDH